MQLFLFNVEDAGLRGWPLILTFFINQTLISSFSVFFQFLSILSLLYFPFHIRWQKFMHCRKIEYRRNKPTRPLFTNSINRYTPPICITVFSRVLHLILSQIQFLNEIPTYIGLSYPHLKILKRKHKCILKV